MMQQQIRLPGWLNLMTCAVVRDIEAETSVDAYLAILARLATDPRMQAVWAELGRRDRTAGGHLYPAKPPPPAPRRSPAEAQAAAMAETLHFAFCAARDKRTASKLDQVEPVRAALLADAATLRRVADDLTASAHAALPYSAGQMGLYLADADALRRVAGLREAQAETIRGADDPITITNSRGDPTERGMQITIAAHLNDRFGDYLHGIAAILTAVALGLPETPSEQISRSGFSRPKRA